MIVSTGKSNLRSRIEAASALFGATYYMALSTDATAPALGDTTIAGEQTANGLARVAVNAAHTAGQNTWTFSNTFTYTVTGTTTTIQKVALWDAPAGGNLITEDVVSATSFTTAGDNCPFAVTFSL